MPCEKAEPALVPFSSEDAAARAALARLVRAQRTTFERTQGAAAVAVSRSVEHSLESLLTAQEIFAEVEAARGTMAHLVEPAAVTAPVDVAAVPAAVAATAHIVETDDYVASLRAIAHRRRGWRLRGFLQHPTVSIALWFGAMAVAVSAAIVIAAIFREGGYL